MYTGKPLPPLPTAVMEAGWADGYLHFCRQSVLGFGSNRKIPVRARPVVAVRKDGGRAVVLPCTSQDKSSSAEFRELTSPDQVMWSQPSTKRTFASRRYETVAIDALGEKVAVMPHSARINLLQWLKERS